MADETQTKGVFPFPLRQKPITTTMLPLSDVFLRRTGVVLAVLALSGLLVYSFSDSSTLLPLSTSISSTVKQDEPEAREPKTLEQVLKAAATEDGTVIITSVNEAWTQPNSLLDIFLESFRIGNGTQRLLDHLIVVAVDHKAYERCLEVHKHCFTLVTEGIDFHQEAGFMSPIYLRMMWRRTEFLQSILQLGYNFVFTDADIMWFRDPFPQFYADADFQISCDMYFGKPEDMGNLPNGGFMHVKSNNRTLEFYRFWISGRDTYKGKNEQDVLNIIKFDPFLAQIGFKMKFLDTVFFGGFCQRSKDLNLVCTMHANCCIGLNKKVNDLRLMLQDWRAFKSLPDDLKKEGMVNWRAPQKCRKQQKSQAQPPT